MSNLNTLSMKKKTAIILDGGFVVIKLKRRMNSFPSAENIIDFAKACLKSGEEELFRIYYYDCAPLETVVTNPMSGSVIDLTKTKRYQSQMSLLSRLAMKDHVAFRGGSLSFAGWIIKANRLKRIVQANRSVNASDFSPDFKQKRVDMKIGLDIAWLASKRIVEQIILVTGDSDFVPAMKFARIEGVKVILVRMGQHVKRELIVHADEDRTIQYPPLPSAQPTSPATPTP